MSDEVFFKGFDLWHIIRVYIIFLGQSGSRTVLPGDVIIIMSFNQTAVNIWQTIRGL